MTNEEAIKTLDDMWKMITSAYDDIADSHVAAYTMAVDALKAQTDGDTISRQDAIDAILAVTGNSSVRELYEHVQEHGLSEMWSGGVSAAIDVIIAVPSAQPEPSEITDEQAIMHLQSTGWMQNHDREMYESGLRERLADDSDSYDALLPSAQPEPMSDAYMKAVWTWLLDYQIKVAELKGRYTPYEVLSWVANDWRREHERLN